MFAPRIPSLLLLKEKKFMTYGPSTSMWHCFIRLSSFVENFPLLPPIEVWAMSQSQFS
ncbi:hypothetical protein AMTRI_Chr12g237700 [Amborella trichopoda]